MKEDSVVTVRVFGVPTTSGCDCGTKGGTWRDATEWVARSLKIQFGDQVRVEYFDLFLDVLDAFPHVMDVVARGEAKPPLVFIGDDQGYLGELLSAGERISGPAIRKRVEALGLKAANPN
jgi:hypothetical protein